jgi:hypothetical protein
MVFRRSLVQTLAGAIARKILDERMWQCKTGPEAERSQASQSRISAIAAGAAWTHNILRLTVTAP